MRPVVTKIISATLSLSLAVWPLPSLADGAVNWDVPQDFAPRDLPPRYKNTTPINLAEATVRALNLMDAASLTEPTLADRVLALGLDPKAAFVMVRDTVQSQPYGGRLRDPAEVFLAGGGNAYDKAAALADILGKMGYDTRLVVGNQPAPTLLDPTPPALCNGNGRAEVNAWRLAGFGKSVMARIQTRAAASYAALRPLLAPVNQPAADTGPHIWLQMRDGGTWVDLDPWALQTEWGAHPMGPGTPLTDLPQAQSVLVTITVERLQDGQLIRNDVMAERLDMPDASGALVTLMFGPKISGLGGTQARIMAELAGGTGEIVANLMVNDRMNTSTAFAAPGAAAVATGFLAEPGAQVTTGVWLTLTSTAPGMADHSETRTIMDLVPPALRGSDAIDAAALLPAVDGGSMPMSLKGLRQIILSNGGTSQVLVAARKAIQMRTAYVRLVQDQTTAVAPLDTIWTSFLEAGRVSLAAETLIRAKPAHDGACLGIDRPRALIWGMVPAPQDQVLRWLDWALDDVAVHGGDAVAQAEARLWHGSVQAALEKEALMFLAQAPDTLFPLDIGTMAAGDGWGLDAQADRARGYVTVANPAMAANLWWRVDPASGRADARAPNLGNAAGYLPPGSGVNAADVAARARDILNTSQAEYDAAMFEKYGNAYYRALETADRAKKAELALEQERAAAHEHAMMVKFGIGIALALGVAALLYNVIGVSAADEVIGDEP